MNERQRGTKADFPAQRGTKVDSNGTEGPVVDSGDEISDDELAAALAQRLSTDKHVHGRRKPTWDANDLNLRLRQYDRTPFLELLQHWLENSPTLADITALAKRSPDRYIAALSSLAKIAGFSEKTESTVNVNMNIGKMSDSQLMDAIRAAEVELGIIDVPYAPASGGDGPSIPSDEAAKLPALVGGGES